MALRDFKTVTGTEVHRYSKIMYTAARQCGSTVNQVVSLLRSWCRSKFLHIGTIIKKTLCVTVSNVTAYDLVSISLCLVTLTLRNPMDCSPPGSSVHEILQARTLEWAAIPFSKGTSWPRDRMRISSISRQILYHWATREAPILLYRKAISHGSS